MKVITDLKNDLLNRREVVFVMESGSNPGVSGVNKAMVDKYKAHEENIAVKKITSNFGKKEFTVEAFVYNTKKDKEMIERKPKVKKAEGAA